MYLRTTQRRNKDGSVVRYYALAENVRHPGKGYVEARMVHSFGRADRLDRAALERLQPVAPCHRRDGRGRVEALGHDPGLLLVGPAATPTDAGDHLDPAEAVVVRTSRSTVITHRSRACSYRLGPSSSSSSAGPQGARQTLA